MFYLFPVLTKNLVLKFSSDRYLTKLEYVSDLGLAKIILPAAVCKAEVTIT
jgi:hypothetical protein